MWDSIIQQGGSLTSHQGLTAAGVLVLAKAYGHAATSTNDITMATMQKENEIKACFMLSGVHSKHYMASKDLLENSGW